MATTTLQNCSYSLPSVSDISSRLNWSTWTVGKRQEIFLTSFEGLDAEDTFCALLYSKTMVMFGTSSFVERLSSFQRLNCTSIIEKGPQSTSFYGLSCPLFRVSIIGGSTVYPR